MIIKLKDNNDLILKKDGMITEVIDSVNKLAKGHEYVEIGGIKWATMNLGATGITDGGILFAWGETNGYLPSQVGTDKAFGWYDYKFNPSGDGSTFTKYKTTDGYKALAHCDDAVATNWGGAWRMPTYEEALALSGAVRTVWVEDYQGSGVNGRLMTDKNDSTKQLFFPAFGYGYGDSVEDEGVSGFYWTSTLYEGDDTSASYFGFNSENMDWEYGDFRNNGFCIRGVLK